MHSALQWDFAGHKVKLLHLYPQMPQKLHDRVKVSYYSGYLTSLTASNPKSRDHKQQQKYNITSLHQHLHPSTIVNRHPKLVFQWNHHWPHCAKCRGWTLTFNWICHKKSKQKKLGYRESVGSPRIFIARRPPLVQKKGIWKAYKKKQPDSLWRSCRGSDLRQHGAPKKQWLRGASKEEETEASSAYKTLQFHKLPQGGIQIDSKRAKS